MADDIDLKSSVCVLQLYDNSVYLVGGPGGVKHLPARDPTGKYHVDGPLIVADKSGVKDLTAKFIPLLRELGECKKVFLTPLARYWLAPCCSKEDHLVNYCEPGYLPKLNNSISALRDCIRDSLFTRRVSNYRVLCPNKMIGLGPRIGGISDNEAREHANRWGSDPVHPTAAAYQKIAEDLNTDLSNIDARYTNPAKDTLMQGHKRPRVDYSLQRDDWVAGCPAALPRRDSVPTPSSRGRPPHRGHKYVRGGGQQSGRGWPRHGNRRMRGRGGRW
jgi:hypothetical protein